MYAIAFGPVWCGQPGHQVLRRKFAQVADWPRRFPGRHNAVDSPFVIPGADIEFGQPFRRNPARVLDDEAIHINDPQSPVRSGARLHRAKPIVLRAKKLALLFVRRARAAEGDAVRPEHEAMHEVMHRLTNEAVAVVICPQQIVAIKPQPAG